MSSHRGNWEVVGCSYSESITVSYIGYMLRVSSTIIIGIHSHYISVSVPLFGFLRVGVAVSILDITEFVLSVVLRSNDALRGGLDDRGSRGNGL